MCGLCCYIGCPPIPESIARKLAFHPPKKGASYTVHSMAYPEKRINGADELADQKFFIVPTALEFTTDFDYERMLSRIKPFTVRTSQGHHLIAVQCWPHRTTTSQRMMKQVIIFTQPNSSDLGSFLQPRYMNLPQFADIFEMDVYGFDYSGCVLRLIERSYLSNKQTAHITTPLNHAEVPDIKSNEFSYGYSTGTASEKNIYSDIRAVYDYVHQTRPDKQIVLLGYSIGTTAVVDLASRRPDGLAGVILVAPFTSGLRLLGNKPRSEKTHFLDRFNSCDKINEINVPVLICHGGRDKVVPSEHGVELHEKLKKPVTPLIVHGADHQSVLNGAYPQTFCRIHRFLKTQTEVELSYEENPSDLDLL